jgi:hypothetical protein
VKTHDEVESKVGVSTRRDSSASYDFWFGNLEETVTATTSQAADLHNSDEDESEEDGSEHSHTSHALTSLHGDGLRRKRIHKLEMAREHTDQHVFHIVN